MRNLEKAVGAAFAVLTGSIVIWTIGVYFELTKSDWAAWVQAIGSIVALAVAIGLAKYQQLRDAKAAKADAEKYQHDMTVLCYLFCDEFCRFLEREKSRLMLNETGTRFMLDERALEEFRVQFRDLPVHTFNIELLSHVLAFRRQVNEIQRRYSYDISAETRAEMTQEMILADE